MGDIDIETKRWNRRVKQYGYNLITLYECEWMEEIENNPEIRYFLSSWSLADRITPRSALYGGRTESICLHAEGDEQHPIKYIDVVSYIYIYIYIIRRFN